MSLFAFIALPFERLFVFVFEVREHAPRFRELDSEVVCPFVHQLFGFLSCFFGFGLHLVFCLRDLMRCNCRTSAGFFRHAAFPFKLERFRREQRIAPRKVSSSEALERSSPMPILKPSIRLAGNSESTEQKLDRSSLIDLE